MTEITQEQIEKLAREIGQRPYHAIVFDTTNLYNVNGILTDHTYTYGHSGISIRQELMRTAMGAIITLEYSQRSGESMAAKSASMFTNALLLQIAKDELGVSNE